jgi:hypothetical protein
MIMLMLLFPALSLLALGCYCGSAYPQDKTESIINTASLVLFCICFPVTIAMTIWCLFV